MNDFLDQIQQGEGLYREFKAKQMTVALNMPLRTVERELKKLKEQGLIHFEGATKTGGYYAK